MSGAVSWKPVEVSEDEYEQVIIELQRLKTGLIRGNSPLNIKTFEEWINWRMISRVGDKGAELADLYRVRAEILLQIELMREQRDSSKAEILQLELMRIDGKIGDLLIEANRKKISRP